MIPQVHDDQIQGEEQVPSPVENKQTAAHLDEPSRSTSVTPRRWIDVLMTILGVALPMLAGSMISWPWGVPDIFDAEWVFNTVVLGTVLSVVVGAFLLRSWWGLLIVPVAWAVGEILGAVLRPLVEGGWPALQAEIHLWDAQGTILSLACLPVIGCAFVGTGLGVFFNQWLKKR